MAAAIPVDESFQSHGHEEWFYYNNGRFGPTIRTCKHDLVLVIQKTVLKMLPCFEFLAIFYRHCWLLYFIENHLLSSVFDTRISAVESTVIPFKTAFACTSELNLRYFLHMPKQAMIWFSDRFSSFEVHLNCFNSFHSLLILRWFGRCYMLLPRSIHVTARRAMFRLRRWEQLLRSMIPLPFEQDLQDCPSRWGRNISDLCLCAWQLQSPLSM